MTAPRVYTDAVTHAQLERLREGREELRAWRERMAAVWKRWNEAHGGRP